MAGVPTAWPKIFRSKFQAKCTRQPVDVNRASVHFDTSPPAQTINLGLWESCSGRIVCQRTDQAAQPSPALLNTPPQRKVWQAKGSGARSTTQDDNGEMLPQQGTAASALTCCMAKGSSFPAQLPANLFRCDATLSCVVSALHCCGRCSVHGV